MSFDIVPLRRQFPILSKRINGQPLIYLDNAATTQKPQCVIDALSSFYAESNANVNRGVHPLAEESTAAYQKARKAVQKFIHAKRSHEILFTRNATEAINLVARSFGESLKKGDTIALTIMEHHSNIVPWMQLASRKNARIEWIGIDDVGTVDARTLKTILKKKPKLLAITGMSNVLGTLPDLETIIGLAHESGAKVLVDAAQLAAHKLMNVQKLDCDFLAFSGHKLYGPMGIGVLYGKEEILKEMPSFLGGGDMIQTVTEEGFTEAELPRKFEAGTVSAADAVGLEAAIKWMEEIGFENIERQEQTLIAHALEELKKIKGLRILGTDNPKLRHGCISFVVDGVHPHDLTDVLGKQGICLRSGHHCTQPLHRSLGINASSRLSIAVYNTTEEIDRCIEAMKEAVSLLKK